MHTNSPISVIFSSKIFIAKILFDFFRKEFIYGGKKPFLYETIPNVLKLILYQYAT